MKQQMPCEVVQDLLPLYVDGLTRETSAQLVEQHLQQCQTCRRMYEDMVQQVQPEGAPMPKIDYLKKLRRQRWELAASCVAAVLAMAAAAVLGRLFVWGYPVQQYMVQVQQQEDVLMVQGMMTDSATVFCRSRVVQGDKGAELVIYGCLASPWNRDGGFEVAYEMGQGSLLVQGSQYFPDGSVITQQAFALYEAKNPYIGNASADVKLAGILQTGTQVGAFLNQLYTSQEPYAWELQFQQELTEAQKQTMQRHACVLLALIENCGEIRWTYPQNGVVQRESLSREQAADMLRQDPQYFAKSPQMVQQLLECVRLLD